MRKAVGLFLVLCSGFVEFLDWLGRIEIIEKHLPKWALFTMSAQFNLAIIFVGLVLIWKWKSGKEQNQEESSSPAFAKLRKWVDKKPMPSLAGMMICGAALGAILWFGLRSATPQATTQSNNKPTDTKPQEQTNDKKEESKKNEQPAKKKAKQKVEQSTQGNSPNIGSVTQGPGSALSVGQRGGVTAGTYIGSPPPQFSSLSKISENVSDGSLYETKFRVQVVTSQPITFHVKVTGQQIEDVRIDNERPPEQGGMSFQSTTQSSAGWLQNNYVNIESGAYFIIIRTHVPQKIQLAYW